MLAQVHTKCIFHNFFVSSISYRPTDLSLLKEFSKNVATEVIEAVEVIEAAEVPDGREITH